MIATVPLSNNLMAELMPKGVMVAETRKLHYYYRPSPDGTCILFGGRDGTIAGEPDWPTKSLKRALADIFPVLEGVDLTHSWYGHVAMSRDMIPRIFSRDGMRYAVGYCGSGVVWARWAGQKAAWQILGDSGGGVGARPPAAAGNPALHRHALVPAGRLCVDDAAGPAGPRAQTHCVGQAGVASPPPQCLVSPAGISATSGPGAIGASSAVSGFGADSCSFCWKRR